MKYKALEIRGCKKHLFFILNGLAACVNNHTNVCLFAGKPLQLHLQACDVKSKEEKSGPENMLTEPNTGDGTHRS